MTALSDIPCPICGVASRHSHSDREIFAWIKDAARWMKDAAARIAQLEALIAEMAQDPMGEYYQGLRCGVEDRDIMCRYEAAEYGWQEAFEYIGSIANNSLPTSALDTGAKG